MSPIHWLKPHQDTLILQTNHANATSLFSDNVDSHNIVLHNFCNGSIILTDNLWHPAHCLSRIVAAQVK